MRNKIYEKAYDAVFSKSEMAKSESEMAKEIGELKRTNAELTEQIRKMSADTVETYCDKDVVKTVQMIRADKLKMIQDEVKTLQIDVEHIKDIIKEIKKWQQY